MKKGLSKYDELFGKHVKQRRMALGYNQVNFAKKLGISQEYLCRIEAGARHLNSAKTLFTKIANELQITEREINLLKDGKLPPFSPRTDFASVVKLCAEIPLSPDTAKDVLSVAQERKVDVGIIIAELIAKEFPAP